MGTRRDEMEILPLDIYMKSLVFSPQYSSVEIEPRYFSIQWLRSTTYILCECFAKFDLDED